MLSKQWHNEAYNTEIDRIKKIYMGYQNDILRHGSHYFDTVRGMFQRGVPKMVTNRIFQDSGSGCASEEKGSLIYRTRAKRIFQSDIDGVERKPRELSIGTHETDREPLESGYERILKSTIVQYIEEYIDTLQGEIRE